jgi:hypothetical protein
MAASSIRAEPGCLSAVPLDCQRKPTEPIPELYDPLLRAGGTEITAFAGEGKVSFTYDSLWLS